ncbi:hypothetical protein GH714_003042 [Hevea brasiliensis]|uniref:G domain-containing protein n=1 Tax=Hevea brasiliensis TaxID=3981 RepID=A0A6A6NC00_HEVBR|nr:hypothetical protein GH714_003042 [Hevea brasiliensis]
MAAASRAIAERIPLVDFILEIPLSSECQLLTNHLPCSRRIIVMNKMDLANRSHLKIGSHPNIYVLDTPSILPTQILDAEVCSRLALTGAISDSLIGEKELAQYFLAILNLSDEYKKWAKLSALENERSFIDHKEECSSGRQPCMKGERQHFTDHTQDFIVHNVRRKLFETISCFNGDMQNEVDLEKLIELQFTTLTEAFHLPIELGDNARSKVATKLLNLYRIGRLGHYTLDPLAF